MSDVTKKLDILKQLFSNPLEQDKQSFLAYVFQNNDVKKVAQPKKNACCSHCQSTHFFKNGKECSNQKYFCREYKKSSIEQRGTILYNSQKDIEAREKYIHCKVEKYPFRKCVETCCISLRNAFSWLHKILDVLHNMINKVELDGAVQADETYSTIFYKENHRDFKLPRFDHKRETRASKCGISKEQVCVPYGVNLEGPSIAKISSLGKPSLKNLDKILNRKIAKDSVFVTDSHHLYKIIVGYELKPYLHTA